MLTFLSLNLVVPLVLGKCANIELCDMLSNSTKERVGSKSNLINKCWPFFEPRFQGF